MRIDWRLCILGALLSPILAQETRRSEIDTIASLGKAYLHRLADPELNQRVLQHLSQWALPEEPTALELEREIRFRCELIAQDAIGLDEQWDRLIELLGSYCSHQLAATIDGDHPGHVLGTRLVAIVGHRTLFEGHRKEAVTLLAHAKQRFLDRGLILGGVACMEWVVLLGAKGDAKLALWRDFEGQALELYGLADLADLLSNDLFDAARWPVACEEAFGPDLSDLTRSFLANEFRAGIPEILKGYHEVARRRSGKLVAARLLPVLMDEIMLRDRYERPVTSTRLHLLLSGIRQHNAALAEDRGMVTSLGPVDPRPWLERYWAREMEEGEKNAAAFQKMRGRADNLVQEFLSLESAADQ